MPPNRIGKNRLDMSGGIRMPVCMKSPNILIVAVRHAPKQMRMARKKDRRLQRTRPGQSNALFDTAGRIFRLPTRLSG
ncbi:hypothetical protein M717_02025 [Neisseria gonorrhoeae SK33414]|nr:hypothetical protein M717_12425 [Neisseria gonorrhoeae SK33414]KLR76535.1 hypothetical protein M717_08800 [Neisseria gonorrhoeae SK33414]KLR76913.1 hypothetical protein M717_06215 [Neisseria gonorrhoeae SK33414]KLR78127.1 hypothetical protein M717_01525 [Neisseria gonorrhoeae SK33414]KLR78162.1 hypothetical protein M717_02025 [Neisseria gonorrhoeae SK33414]